ncbi:hypothetical protein WUBG_12379, partial [Wuchereria bancrofti]
MATNSTEFINNPLSTISNNDRSEMRRDDPSVSSYDYDVSSVSQEKGLIACLVDDYKKQ